MPRACRRSGTRRTRWVVLLLAAGAAVAVADLPASAVAGTTDRVSVAGDGTQADAGGARSAISADGRDVAFVSFASNLVSGDTNGVEDVFVHDRLSGLTERVSVASDGTQADKTIIFAPAISADGRDVAFVSDATTLVPDDTNRTYDVFVRDRQAGITERVSVASDGTQANSFSDEPAAISADGRYVAFATGASNLVAGDTNHTYDVFVRDRQTGTTERASVASDGTQGNGPSSNEGGVAAFSADGRYLVFASRASNLVAGDTNGQNDVFVRDRQTGVTTRVSVASDGTQANDFSSPEAVSADGRYVLFGSTASNLVAGDTNGTGDVFVRDRQTGTTERVDVASDGSQSNGFTYGTAVDADGRYAAFVTYATNLVPGDTNGTYDVFVRDRQTGLTDRISVASDGAQGNDGSVGGALSADGRYVAFDSGATNFVTDDTNGSPDVFVRDRSQTAIAPVWQAPTPADGTVETVDPGDGVAVDVQAGEDGPGHTLTLSASGVPVGGSFTHTDGNPATGSLTWTPTAADAGDHLVTFGARDETGATAPRRRITIRVVTGGAPLVVDAHNADRTAAMGPPVSTPDPLSAGSWYAITAAGTYSTYTRQLMRGPLCGIAEPSPRGPTGADAATIFARPLQTISDCSLLPQRSWFAMRIGDPARTTLQYRLPVGGKHTSPDHTYAYYVKGKGFPATFAIRDTNPTDNYGHLTVTVRPAGPADCENGGWQTWSHWTSEADCLAGI